MSGESVVKDILDGIAHARLVLADITSSRMTDADGLDWPQRNGNVMWEVGIAHTMRLPDEVLMVRSDNDESIFDLTQFRAFQYDPSNVSQARRLLKALGQDRLKSLDQSKSDYVRRCAEALTSVATKNLLFGVPHDGSRFQVEWTLGTSVSWSPLFELGLVRGASFTAVPGPKPVTYDIQTDCVITPLGQWVVGHIQNRITISKELKGEIQKIPPNELTSALRTGLAKSP